MVIPENIKTAQIDEVLRWITNVDRNDLRENYASDIRGLRLTKPGIVMERDFGTKHRYPAASYPSKPSAVTIIDGFNMYLPSEGAEYDIVVGLDTSNNMRIYVGDGTTFSELTESFTMVITSISGQTFVANTLKDSLGVAFGTALGADYFRDWIAVTPTGFPGLITASTAYSGAGNITFTLPNKPDTALLFNVGDTVTLYHSTGILPSTILGTSKGLNGSGRGYEFQNGVTPHIRWLDVEAQQKLTMFYGNSATIPTMRQPIQIKKGKMLGNGAFTIGGSETGWSIVNSPTAGANIEGVGTIKIDVTAATNATPVEITTATNHGLSVNDIVYLSNINGNTNANGKFKVKTVVSVTKIELKDYFTGADIAGNGAYSGSGGFLELVWAGCTDSRIYLSADGSYSWIDQQTGGGNAVMCMQMIDKDTGYAGCSGGQVFKATAANQRTPGLIWNTVGSAGMIASLATFTGISFVDASNGWVVGGVKAYKTVDGGTNWTDVSAAIVAGGMTGVNSIFMFDATHGIAVGVGGKMRYTTDGTNWSSSTTTIAEVFYAVHMTSTTVGYAVGPNNLIYKTTDGGNNWTSVTNPTGQTLYAVRFNDANKGRAVGRSGAIAVTTNGGTSWGTEVSNTTDDLFDISQFTSDYAYASGANGRLIRLSGGAGTKGTGANQRWDINKAQLLPDYHEFGLITVPLDSTSGAQSYVVSEEGMLLTITPTEETDTGNRNYVRMYVTVLYGDYTFSGPIQESDPVAAIFLKPTATDKFPSCSVKVALDPGRVNKNVIGFRFYHATRDDIDLPFTSWVNDPEEYLQAYELLVDSVGWTIDINSRYCYTNTVTQFTLAKVHAFTAARVPNLLANLNHVPDTDREYLTPRYAIKVARQQYNTVVVDQDNLTLRLSSYDGKNVHEDDNFPDVVTDESGRRQVIELSGRGDLDGLAVLNDVLHAWRGSELELFDLQSGESQIVPVDFYAKRSIVPVGVSDSPIGLVWVGRSGIYLKRRGGGAIENIAKEIVNFIDGTLMIDDGVTPYVTDSARAAILAGYNQTYRAAWFQVQANKRAGGGTEYLNLRYYFEDGRFDVREVNAANPQIRFFSGKKDGTITLGLTNGLLLYPNRITDASSHCFEDEVSGATPGVSASRGIPTKIRINLGGLYALFVETVPFDILLDYIGTAANNNAFDVKFYVNGNSTAIDTKSFVSTAKPYRRGIRAYVGQIRRLEMEISFPSANLHQFKSFELSKAEIRFVGQQRAGHI